MKKNYLLWLFFALALAVRFYSFPASTYFGFDEARDAFVSQGIYRQGDFKLIGPPANAPGLNHGVLHWYILGIFYVIGQGNPFFVSAIFRAINALAIFPIYWIAEKLFEKRVAYITCLIFAVSFEAVQYAMYYGNPSLAVWSWICLFAGAVVILKSKNKFFGLPLMSLGIASGAQLELFLVTLVFVGVLVLVILWKEVKKIGFKSWITSILIGSIVVSPYILGEIKNGFRSLTSAINLISSGYSVSGSQSKWFVYIERWILMLHDNFLPVNNFILKTVAVILLCFWIYQGIKKVEYQLLLSWIVGGVFVFILGAYNSYYINVGIGTGLIIGISTFLDRVFKRNFLIGLVLTMLVLWGNLSEVVNKSKDGLIQDIKTQQYMLLTDEIKVIGKIYDWADDKAFSIRITSMPYRIQTVWAYLFDRYGKSTFGYLPYYETGNILGYPGYLPQPKNGSTCIRFLLREPVGGIPIELIEKDTREENYFSDIQETVEIGHFYLEKRHSKAKDCHDIKP